MADPISVKTSNTTITVNSIAIGGIRAITGMESGSAEVHDITTLLSTAVEKRQGLTDNGQITIEFSRRNSDDVGQAELRRMKLAQETQTFVVTASESTLNVWTFSGFVTSLTRDIDRGNGVIVGQATVEITGTVVES